MEGGARSRARRAPPRPFHGRRDTRDGRGHASRRLWRIDRRQARPCALRAARDGRAAPPPAALHLALNLAIPLSLILPSWPARAPPPRRPRSWPRARPTPRPWPTPRWTPVVGRRSARAPWWRGERRTSERDVGARARLRRCRWRRRSLWLRLTALLGGFPLSSHGDRDRHPAARVARAGGAPRVGHGARRILAPDGGGST